MSDGTCELQIPGISFVVRIICCESFSYQGEITWLERNKVLYFRSALEMMTLIQEAVDESDMSPPDCHPRSWGEKDDNDRVAPSTESLGRS